MVVFSLKIFSRKNRFLINLIRGIMLFYSLKLFSRKNRFWINLIRGIMLFHSLARTLVTTSNLIIESV